MTIEQIEQVVRWAGAAGLAVFLVIAFGGMFSLRKRPKGRTEGKLAWFLQWPVYFTIAAAFAAICWLLWMPLPFKFPDIARWIFLIAGIILYFAGIAFYIWGRFALGNMFAGSSGFAVQLYADHRLVTGGPFSIVRHPLYLGVMVASLGALLVYQNWATVFLFLCFIWLPFRGRKEEKALAKEFGQEWTDYCRRVPAFIPHIFKRKPSSPVPSLGASPSSPSTFPSQGGSDGT